MSYKIVATKEDQTMREAKPADRSGLSIVRRSEAAGALFRPSRRQSELLGSFPGKSEIGLRLINQLRSELRVRLGLGQALEVRRALKTLADASALPACVIVRHRCDKLTELPHASSLVSCIAQGA
jgi:hypothetical protein